MFAAASAAASAGSKFKILASLGVAWEGTCIAKQTLFAVWGDQEERRARKGVPAASVRDYTLRATKGVNMHPCPQLRLVHAESGQPYTAEEQLSLSLVAERDRLPPPAGSCSCKGRPLLSESKPFQLEHRNGGETLATIRGGMP